MSRRNINDLWESSIDRIDFIKRNDIGIIGSDKKNQLPENVYNSIVRENPVQNGLIMIHNSIFDLLVEKYNFIDSSDDIIDEDDENYPHKLIDLILEDKRINESIESFKERLKNESAEAKELEEMGIKNVDDKGLISIIKELINFKILLYMLCHVNKTDTPYVKRGEFALNDFEIVFNNNPELFFEDRDKGVINKINCLFSAEMSTNKFHDMCNLYFNYLDKDVQIFNLEEKVITLNKDKSEDINEEVARTLKVISINKDSLLLRSWQMDRNIFNKIIQDPWFYEYKPSINANILNANYLGEKYIPSSSFYEIKTDDKGLKAINKFFSEDKINEGHHWIVTEVIEHHKERKKNKSILDSQNNINIDLLRSAKSIDKKLMEKGLHKKAIWESSRLPEISINEINYSSRQSGSFFNTNIASIHQKENILGLLGAGKSTFSRIAANDIVDQGGVVVFLVDSIASGLTLANEFKEDGTKAVVLKGDSNCEEQLINYVQNKFKNNRDVFSFFESERNNLKFLDPTSQSKAALENTKKMNIDGKTVDTIYIMGKGKNNKKKKITYINPEVKDCGIYSKFRELKDAQVIIVNYNAYVKTKIPIGLDIFERDFFTVLHLIADVIFVDEVDLAQSKFTQLYIGDMNIASSSPENKFTNNYLELLTPYINKVKTKRKSKDAIFNDTVNDQTSTVSDVFAIQEIYNYKEISYAPFTLYSLQMDFFIRYFEVESIEVYRLKEFQAFKNITESAIRNNFDMKNATPYSRHFKELLNILSDPSFYFNTKVNENKLKKEFAKFINSFIAAYDLTPKKTLYIDPKIEEIEEDNVNKQLEIENIKEYNFDPSKYLEYNKLSNESYTRLLFLTRFCIFNKNQIYLNNHTLSFVCRNNDSQARLPDDIGELPLRQNAGIYPFAPKALVKESHSYTLKKDRDDRDIVHLKMKEYKLIGDKVLTDSNTFYSGIEDTNMPSLVMMSATSYLPTSSMYHNKYLPNYLIKNKQQLNMNINCKFIPVLCDGVIATVSANKKGKQKSLESMVKELSKENGLFDKQLEKAKIEYENNKAEFEKLNPGKEFIGRPRIIGIPVTSFELVYTIKNLLDQTKFKGRVRAQFRTEDVIKYKKLLKDVNLDEYISRERVHSLHEEDCDIFIFVMNSVGRGFNLLQGEGSFKSLIGSMFFLVRPYLTAEDFADAIFNLHNSLPEIINSCHAKFSNNDYVPASTLYNLTIGVCHRLYNKLVGRNISWNELDEQERFIIASNYLVLLYQTIGRGLRGGTDLDVFFVDGKFIGDKTLAWILENGVGENYGYIPQDEKHDSYLSIFETLTNSEDFLVKELYSKLGYGLKGIALKE